MDQHPGASITLSFALVVLFAIILYQPNEAPAPPAPPGATAVEAQELRPSSAVPPPTVTPGEPLAESPERPVAEHPRTTSTEGAEHREDRAGPRTGRRDDPELRMRTSNGGGGRPPGTAERAESGAAPVAPASRVAARATAGGEGVPPHDAFTVANQGETLRDVALRVYGSPDEAEALWRLNRDLVGRRDVPLPAGTLLRTP
jgi:hypothetical protein